VLNSLIIFCVANGANSVGVTQRADLSLVGSAFAQSSNKEEIEGRLKSLTDRYQKLKVSVENDLNEIVSIYVQINMLRGTITEKIQSAKTDSASKEDVLNLISQRDRVDQLRDSTLLSQVQWPQWQWPGDTSDTSNQQVFDPQTGRVYTAGQTKRPQTADPQNGLFWKTDPQNWKTQPWVVAPSTAESILQLHKALNEAQRSKDQEAKGSTFFQPWRF